MKNIIKTTAYSAVALSSVAFTAAVDYGTQHGKEFAGTSGEGDIMGTIKNLLNYLLGFLSIIAVIFAIYGGFQILTAGGDDEKVKKGKTTLINALIGIFIIMVSWTLVSWIFTSTASTVVATGG